MRVINIILAFSMFSLLLATNIEGLEFSIQTNKRIYLLEEPIECRFIFKNMTSHSVEVRNSRDNPIPVYLELIIVDKLGRKIECASLSISTLKPTDYQKYYVKLALGDSLVKYGVINDQFGVLDCATIRKQTGAYKICGKYYDSWKGEAVFSDTVIIEVKAPINQTDAYVLGLYRKANNTVNRNNLKKRMDLYSKIAKDYPHSAYAPYASYYYTWLSMYSAYFSDEPTANVAIKRVKEHVNRYPDFAQSVALGKILFLQLFRCYQKSFGEEAYKLYLNNLQNEYPDTILDEAIEETKDYLEKHFDLQW